ncbi:MAG: IS3 family transposase [Deinococcota bacterium]
MSRWLPGTWRYSPQRSGQPIDEPGLPRRPGGPGRTGEYEQEESFFSPLKRELLLDHVVQTRQEGRLQVVENVEVFDNRQRRHSTLEDKTPVAFEPFRAREAAELKVRKTEAGSMQA